MIETGQSKFEEDARGASGLLANQNIKVFNLKGSNFHVDDHYDISTSLGGGAYGLVCTAVDLRLVPGNERYNENVLKFESSGNFIVRTANSDCSTTESRPPQYLESGLLKRQAPVATLEYERHERRMTRSGSVSPYVAIKKVPKVLDDLVDGRRILRELKILRYLSGHPNIIRVLDVMCPIFGSGIMRDIYIVTELLDTDLYALLKSHHRLELDQIRFISYQLIKALLYTHSSGVIHRDVKPANILLDGDCTAKLCDFGLARGGVFLPAESGTSEFERFRFNAYKVDEEKNENNKQFFSLTDYVVTRYYRAPELLVLGKYNHAVDMWSVGCILAEMFSRKPLFPGANYLSQLSLILETPGIGGIPANEADVDDLFEGGEEGKLFMKELLFRKEHSQYRGSPDVLRSSTIGSSTAPSEAVSLLFSLLCVNPRERPTALEALRHPFFNAVYRKEDEIIRDFSTTESDGQEQGSDEDPSSVKVDAAEPLMWGFDHQITDASSLQRMFLEEVSIYRAIKQQLLDMKK